MDYNIENKIISLKTSLWSSICNLIVKLDEEVNTFTDTFNPHMIKLIACLGSFQEDNNFLVDEAKAFGEYLKSKGCTKEDIKLIAKTIVDYFD